ncbi:MAG: serine hydrolase domain-containing protein [Polyangiaceae bacterium]
MPARKPREPAQACPRRANRPSRRLGAIALAGVAPLLFAALLGAACDGGGSPGSNGGALSASSAPLAPASEQAPSSTVSSPSGDASGADADDSEDAGGGAAVDLGEGASSLAEADAAKLDAAVQGAIARGEIPGAVAMVVAGDRVVHHRAYGLRSKEPVQNVMRQTTVFDLASLTKPVATALSIGLLVERGKLRFSDPAARYLKDFGGDGREAVTIAHLLLHTSGLPADNALSEEAHRRPASRLPPRTDHLGDHLHPDDKRV